MMIILRSYPLTWKKTFLYHKFSKICQKFIHKSFRAVSWHSFSTLLCFREAMQFVKEYHKYWRLISDILPSELEKMKTARGDIVLNWLWHFIGNL